MKYKVSLHAVERASERLGVAKQHAPNYLNQLMDQAVPIEDNGCGLAFYHKKKDTTVILDKNKEVVITAYLGQKSPTPSVVKATPSVKPLITDTVLVNALTSTFKENYNLLLKDLLTLYEREAELNYLMARLRLGRFNAVTDSIRSELVVRCDDVTRKLRDVGSQINKKNNHMKLMKDEVTNVLKINISELIKDF